MPGVVVSSCADRRSPIAAFHQDLSRGRAGEVLRFTAEHRFPGPRDAVAAILRDPDFYRALELPDLKLLEVLPADTSRTDASKDVDSTQNSAPLQPNGLLLRYEFTGNLDATARRLLGGERLTWTQEVHLADASGGRLAFSAEANPRLLFGHADFVLASDLADGAGAASTVRRLDGELTVAIPLVGGMAERRIVPGVLNRLDLEAEGVRERLSGN